MGIAYLDAFFAGYQVLIDGAGVEYPRQSKLKVIGSTITDDPATGVSSVMVAGTGVDLAGDLGNTVATPRVIGLYGQPLDAATFAAPAAGAVPHFDGANWVASTTLAVALTMALAGIANASTPGFTLSNTTAATAGVIDQYSPGLELAGSGWDSGGGVAQAFGWLVQGACSTDPANPDGAKPALLRFAVSVGGSAYVSILYLDADSGGWRWDAAQGAPLIGQFTKTSAGNAATFTHSAQAPSDGNGGNHERIATDGAGTDKNGGAITDYLGGPTGTGTGGAYTLRQLTGGATLWTVSYTGDGTLTGTLTAGALASTSDVTGTVQGNTAGIAGAPSMLLKRSRSSLATISINDYLGTVGWEGYDGATWQETATISAFASGAVSAGVVPTDLIFSTSATNTAGLTERVRLTSAGVMQWVYQSATKAKDSGGTARSVWDLGVTTADTLTVGGTALPTVLRGATVKALDANGYSVAVSPDPHGTNTTSDATTLTTVLTLSTTTNKHTQWEVRVCAYDTTGNKMFVHRATVDVKNVGGTVTVALAALQPNGGTGTYGAYDGIGVAAAVAYNVSGTNVLVQVKGKAGTNLNWVGDGWPTTLGALA